MSEKWQVAVYKLSDEDKESKKAIHQLCATNSTLTEEQEHRKIRSHFLKTDLPQFSSQTLTFDGETAFDLFLFYRKSQKPRPDWKNFLENHVDPSADILKSVRGANESFALFFLDKNHKNLYVVTGGFAHLTIQKHVQDDFGLSVLERLLDGKNEKALLHSKELGLTGGIVGISKFFRNNFNFYENRSFGNVYRELTAIVSKEKIQELGFSDVSSALCLAKSSFKITKPVSFEEMIRIVEKLDELLRSSNQNFVINDIKHIDKKKHRSRVKKLEAALDTLLYRAKSNAGERDEFDLTHKEFDKYLLAERFEVNNTSFTDRRLIFESVIQQWKSLKKKEFISKAKNAYIESFDQSGDSLTNDRFMNHLIREVKLGPQSYFFINGKWFEISDQFNQALESACSSFVVENKIAVLDKPWPDSKEEGDYNSLYKNEDGHLVLDTITPDGIELCDVLKIDGDKVYLVHVKKGFNGKMRELSSQITIAAHRLQEELSGNSHDFLEKLFNEMQNSKDYKDQIHSLGEFKEIFAKKICFVLAVKDTATTERDIRNIDHFKSTIAKFSLNELINELRIIDVEFKITQLHSIHK